MMTPPLAASGDADHAKYDGNDHTGHPDEQADDLVELALGFLAVALAQGRCFLAVAFAHGRRLCAVGLAQQEQLVESGLKLADVGSEAADVSLEDAMSALVARSDSGAGAKHDIRYSASGSSVCSRNQA